jgi:hypothetical protein
MKRSALVFGLSVCMVFSSCEVLEEVVNTTGGGGTTTDNTPKLTNDEVIAGLKEALKIGIQNGANMASKVDGFYKNPAIMIPFPPDAQAVKDKAIEWGMEAKVTEIETTLNRAAEEASKKAAPIFVDAITNMSVSDGFAILNGADDAATNYLKNATTPALTSAFKPVVHEAIATVKLTSLWNPLADKYNKFAKIAGKPEVNPDLDQYVTDLGIKGLFHLVKQEEAKIRKDPVAQVTDLLKKVFGSLLD